MFILSSRVKSELEILAFRILSWVAGKRESLYRNR